MIYNKDHYFLVDNGTRRPSAMYKWSPHNGYVHRTDFVQGSYTVIDSPMDINNLLEFTAAILHRLSKTTKYDYLRLGCYSMMRTKCKDMWHTLPQHWVIGRPCILDAYREPYTIVDMTFSDICKKHANEFTVEYICGIGIPLTRSILSIIDITIITTGDQP